jgi:hypothetical protein
VPSDFGTLLDGPAVMWRMERPNGLRSHLVLGRDAQGIHAIWFLNQTPLGMRDFSDWDSALQWAERMQAQNWCAGWRLVSDEPD